ncbi:glucose-6-phosphate dehydrogenase [Buchnera aphidicola]|uniref:glucose-6-phosphate dehydrogenase n=1 Tax=Buchnera aphidicola TaxID=9 RepID=UPI003BEED640
MIIENNQSCDLVIFGTKGDLAKRKLFPALYKLEKSKKIHKNTRIIGVGRAEWNQEEYQNIIKIAIKKFINEKIDENIWIKIKSRLYFCNIDVNIESDFLKLKKIVKNNNIPIYYCAMPPHTFYSICTGLGKINLNHFPARIIVEKPLGTCLETSKKINNHISQYFIESQIFRIDHYLGKESVLNLFSLRFSNSLFFYNWNNKIIDHVQITVSEQVGIENRWNYFDSIGQMKDMIQNHLLQMLTIIAMDQPNQLTAKNIQDEKVKILKALRPINLENVHINTARGQYSSGKINGCYVPAYQRENGAKKHTLTETFASIKVNIDNKKWSGVPFYLRTGKRLAYKYSEIVICFKKIFNNIFYSTHKELVPNQLIIRLEPKPNIKIEFLNKKPGFHTEYNLEKSELKYNISDDYHCIDAYERLLLESMNGKQSLFVSRDEVETAWKWIDSIFFSWKKMKNNNLEFYSAGTWGPNSADHIITRDHRIWYPFN